MNLHAPRPHASMVDADAFRQAMRGLAGGVSIIATGTGDDRTGMTVTSLTSLSLDPPSVLVCVGRQSGTWHHLQRYRVFGVSILDAGQEAIARRFSGADGTHGAERFAGTEWSTIVTGAPLLSGAPAVLDCNIEDMIEHRSHAIVIGQVRALRIGGGEAPLIYWRGEYGSFAP
jgi:flavin reductase (DIM6/NTAB) family NADH-FMN oxidoreductase RutF